MAVDPFDSLVTLHLCIERMETTLLGMREIHRLIAEGPSKEMLDLLIKEAEAQLAEIRRKVFQ
jgi:hypothetical protein